MKGLPDLIVMELWSSFENAQTVGNPLLKAEISDSWGVGLVTQPSFLPGFGAAVDYWDIDITDAITTLISKMRGISGPSFMFSQPKRMNR